MSNVLDRERASDPQSELAQEAIRDVVFTIVDHMPPKAQKRARRELLAFVERLETWQGYYRPLPEGVVPMHPRAVAECHANDRALMAQRQRKAAIMRKLIGEAF